MWRLHKADVSLHCKTWRFFSRLFLRLGLIKTLRHAALCNAPPAWRGREGSPSGVIVGYYYTLFYVIRYQCTSKL